MTYRHKTHCSTRSIFIHILEFCAVLKPCQPASEPASQRASEPASQPASEPASQRASQPASQRASQPLSQYKNGLEMRTLLGENVNCQLVSSWGVRSQKFLRITNASHWYLQRQTNKTKTMQVQTPIAPSLQKGKYFNTTSPFFLLLALVLWKKLVLPPA